MVWLGADEVVDYDVGGLDNYFLLSFRIPCAFIFNIQMLYGWMG
jgi:hypothetical protein